MDGISKRRAELFEEARELALLYDAEVALLIISADGHEGLSFCMEEIVTRFKESGKNHALESNPEETGEHVPKDIDAAKLKSRKLLGKDFAEMSLKEITLLERQLSEGVFFIKDRKAQLLMEELRQSKIQGQQISMKSQLLQRQIKETQKYRLRKFINSIPVSEGIDSAGAIRY